MPRLLLLFLQSSRVEQEQVVIPTMLKSSLQRTCEDFAAGKEFLSSYLFCQSWT
jgi:hypothetical protein